MEEINVANGRPRDFDGRQKYDRDCNKI